MVLAGGLNPATVAEAAALVRPDVVDVSSGVETPAGNQGSQRKSRASWGRCVAIALSPERAVGGRFGPYGGRYVPETLVAALDDLAALYDSVRRDPSFWAEYEQLLADFVGRPSPISEAPRLSARGGRPVVLKREDLNHTGAHKINNTIGQALLALAHGQAAHHRRDRGGPARRGDGHGVRALRAGVRGVHGRRGRAPPAAQCVSHGAARRHRRAGRVRHPDAEGCDQRGAA